MPRILIVSSSSTLYSRVKSELVAMGFEIDSASSSVECLTKLAAGGIDLVLIHLTPADDSFDLCDRIKTDPRFRDVSVVVKLERTDPECVAQGLEAGADGFLTRDLDVAEMGTRLLRIIARKPGDEVQRLREDLFDAYRSFTYLNERYSSELAQRTRAEQEAKRSKQRFELAVMGSGDGIWDWDLSTNEVFFSARWKAQLGHEDNEVRHHLNEWVSRLHPEDRDRSMETIRVYLEGNAPTYELEHRLRHKDGSFRWILSRGVALRDETGRPHRMSGSHTDITDQKRAAETLEREHGLLIALMDNVPDAIYFKDAQSRFVRVNRSMAERFGLSSPDEVVGKSDFDFFDPIHANAAYRDEREVIESGKPVVDREEKEIWPDGTHAWASTTKMPWRDRDGKIIGTFGISRNITERKEAEEALREAEARTRLLLESSSEGIIGVDAAGQVTFVNSAARDILGFAEEEVFGKNAHNLAHYKKADGSPYPNEECPIQIACREGRPCRVDNEVFWRRDGTAVPVEYSSSPLRIDGKGFVGAVIMFDDITERKQAQEELLRAKEEAIAASRAKSEFLANMSHEIRTPMNAIIGMSELLRDTELAPEQREYLEMVRQSADSLLGLINDILDFSKIEAGRLDLDHADFSIREVLGDTLHTLSLRAYQKGLELIARVAPEVPDSLLGDAGRLRQVVMNLVGNALKFTETGEVIVEIELDGIPSDRPDAPIPLHFSVRDTGIGIPKEKQGFIFGAFSQADSSTTRRFGGTGLGLTISSRLVGLMAGRIWVESEVGIGSTFHFTASFERGRVESLDRTLEMMDRLRGLHVLVVDDNATNRRILEETLLMWGMVPVPVDGGIAAIRELEFAISRNQRFELILLDAHMPLMDGFELAEKILSRPDCAGSKVLLLTSGGQPGDITRCQQLGVSAYLTKPVKQGDLRRSILRALVPEESSRSVATPVKSQIPATRPLRILLAEDNLMNQKLATRLLEKQGHTVVVAGDGRKALAALGFGITDPLNDPGPRFDLILMDVQMPDMDGLEATEAIRNREKITGQRVPIVAMTAHAMKGDRERCLQSGMDAYLSKPVKAEALFATINSLDGVCNNGTPVIEIPTLRPASTEIDWKQAMKCVRGDEELLKELTTIFLDECPGWTRIIREAIGNQDGPLLQRTAHTLKGSLATFGARTAREAAEHLEVLGRDSCTDGALGSLDELERELAVVLPELDAFARGNLSIRS